ncbi:MAG: anaerobic ribonucleoside-triphosphate reductase activating protein [Anaerolineae bacterium]
MDIRGWVRTSLIDFPGHIATVLFTGGCDFRCPMCHNADLVLKPGALPAVAPEDVWRFLSQRQGKLTGVVVTGGEPTLQPDLGDFLRAVQDLGYAAKLDTNGYRPDVLGRLLEARLLDYVAMDIKAPPEDYARLAGLPDLDLARIETSIELLCQGDISYEFRTTVVPGLLKDDDIDAIARWLACKGDRATVRYHLQQFRSLHTLDPALASAVPYTVQRLQEMASRARRWLDRVSVRGIGSDE